VARQRTDLLSKLTDAGEEAINRLHDAPGADRLLAVATNMRDRVDELTKKVRGIDAMEKRLRDLERQVEKLSGGAKKTATRSRSAAKSTASRSRAAAKSTTAKARSTASRKRSTPPKKTS
jgi:TolA-binding protein